MRQLPTIIIVLAIIAATCCCKEKESTHRPAGIAFDSIAIDTAVALTADANAPRCALKLDIKIAKGEHAETINNSLLRSGILVPDYLSLTATKLTPQEAIDSFVRKYISDYREFYTPVFQKEKNKAYGQQQFEVTTDVRGGKSGITVYTANISLISGEQNTEYTLVRNIKEDDGKLLTLNDVFADGHKKEIGGIILKQLARQQGRDTDELLQEGYFANGEPYPSENFSLDEDGITFIYINGEIAHRIKGEIHIFVKYAKLNNWLRI